MAVLTSRRFWTALIAMIINIATIVIGIYVKDPDFTKLAIAALTGLDTLAGIVIALFTVDDTRLNVAQVNAKKAVDVAAVEAGTHPDFPVQGVKPVVTVNAPSVTPLTAADVQNMIQEALMAK